ncbi:pirin family protein [Marinobacter salsuginis]|uniref:pirin family protein n=1 Tax=Marinobacter salsuginis TaxID=418719 RepID=UPI001ADF8E0A|nr:pirin family protein [Marinobacter salsuginis]QTN40796.1 pirin family protein [Marinobacter salsuginis]
MTHQVALQTDSQSALAQIKGTPLSVGSGFTGVGFRHVQFYGAMDPFIMVDHYTMTEPTFGAHPHAGLSAVTVLFEDTEGKFNNRDSLGNDFDINPGDLYWLNAGSGAIHDEAPRKGASIHGLQIFVNLPARMKHQAPSSLHVKQEDMPTLKGQGFRVRLVLGQSNGVETDAASVWPATILDGFADKTSVFEHRIQAGFNAWIYSVEGDIEFHVRGEWFTLHQGESSAIVGTEGETVTIRGKSPSSSHFALLSGETINENFVQHGPFAMSTQQEIDEVVARYNAGELGSLV